MWLKKLRKRKMQHFIIAFILMISTAILLACISFTLETSKFVDDYYGYDKCPIYFDIISDIKGVDILEHDQEAMALIDHIDSCDARYVKEEFYNGDEKLNNESILVYSLDDVDSLEYDLPITSGIEANHPGDGEMWICRVFADATGLEVGDEFRIGDKDGKEYLISAIVDSPECSSGFLDNYPCYVNTDTINEMTGQSAKGVQIYAKNEDVTLKDMENALPEEFNDLVISDTNSDTLKLCLSILSNIFGGVGVAAAILILGVSIIVIRYMVRSVIDKEYHMIGVYMAIGKSYKDIFKIYFTSYMVTGAISWNVRNSYFDEGAARVKINNLIFALEEDEGDGSKAVAFDLPYCLFDEAGQVCVSTMSDYQTGDVIDLHTLGGARQYLVPISNSKDGVNILYVDCSGIYSRTATVRFVRITGVAVILWLAFIIILIRQRLVFRKDIFEPVEEIHNSTKNILSGNLSTEVKYDYDGEIGSLCHDFEKMRDELADSKERELQLKEKVHVMYGSISHDLRTPLATITGYLEAILYDVVQSPEEIKAYTERMLNKSQVLNKLIDDILEHSKAELNELAIKKQEVYARDYFKQLLEGYSEDAKQNNFTFTYDLPDNIVIMLDPSRIEEVFQNIIGNSLKYGHKPINIEVSFELFKEQQSMLLINIKDNGPGIDAADLPFIFDMFYRGNKARTQDVPGSGLGLNIVKYIVEKHGGHIECDSIIGVGTCMSFSLSI